MDVVNCSCSLVPVGLIDYMIIYESCFSQKAGQTFGADAEDYLGKLSLMATIRRFVIPCHIY